MTLRTLKRNAACGTKGSCSGREPFISAPVRVNTEARLRALKIGLLMMAGLALLAMIPASRLPNYRPGEIPDDAPTGRLKSN